MSGLVGTDYFDTPFSVGDRVIWPVASDNSAFYHDGTVAEIVPLIPNPNGSAGFVREDQLSKSRPTVYSNPKRMYALKVRVPCRKYDSVNSIYIDAFKNTGVTPQKAQYVVKAPA